MNICSVYLGGGGDVGLTDADFANGRPGNCKRAVTLTKFR